MFPFVVSLSPSFTLNRFCKEAQGHGPINTFMCHRGIS